jgi:hypothetical protein
VQLISTNKKKEKRASATVILSMSKTTREEYSHILLKKENLKGKAVNRDYDW